MELPYDIISIITELSDKKDIISLLFINKYYVLYPYLFNTEMYENITQLSEFRKFYPNKLSITYTKNVDLFSKLSVLEMSPKTFLKLDTPLTLKYLILSPMKIRHSREIIIDNHHRIQTLELRSFQNKNITINCKSIENLKIYECKNSTVNAIDTENYLKTLDIELHASVKIYGIENNPNLIIYNFYYVDWTYTQLSKCTIFHYNGLLSDRLKINILNQIQFDHSVTHCFEDLSLNNIDIFAQNSILFKLLTKEYYNELDPDTDIEKLIMDAQYKKYRYHFYDINGYMKNIKTKYIELMSNKCNKNITIKNCNITNLKITTLESNKCITIENCKIDNLEHIFFGNIQLIIINTEINKIKNLSYQSRLRNKINLIFSNSILKILDYKSYENLNMICSNTKINEIFLKIGNGMTGGRMLIGNDVDCFRVVTTPTSNKSYLQTYDVKLLKLLLNVPIEIYGLPDLIYIDRNSIATAFIISELAPVDINESEYYIKLDKSYVFNVYAKKL